MTRTEPLAEVARTAEEALFDVVLSWEELGVAPPRGAGTPRRHGHPLPGLADALTATARVGLVGAADTATSGPYAAARQVLALDRSSGGRMGWHVVASPSGGCGRTADELARYRRADEFLRLVHALWDTGDDTAPADGGASPPFAFRGEHFAVEGVGSLEGPSPQGRPVQFHAGDSDVGRRFAARHADVVLSSSPDLGHARATRAHLASIARAERRDPGRLLVLPSVSLVIGATETEAEDLRRAACPALAPEGLLAVRSYDGAADVLEEWFRAGAADGFVLDFPAGRDQLGRFAEHLVPRLQDRGLHRRAYAGSTLRENLGLER